MRGLPWVGPVCLSFLPGLPLIEDPLSPSFSSSFLFLYLLVSLRGCAVRIKARQTSENHVISHRIVENSCLPGQAPTLQMWCDGRWHGVTDSLSEHLGQGQDLLGLGLLTSEPLTALG